MSYSLIEQTKEELRESKMIILLIIAVANPSASEIAADWSCVRSHAAYFEFIIVAIALFVVFTVLKRTTIERNGLGGLSILCMLLSLGIIIRDLIWYLMYSSIIHALNQ